jgi:putative flippase GtrA
MEKLRNILRKILDMETGHQILRYGIITLLSYLFIVIGVFILKNYLNIDEEIAYTITLSLAYIGVYIGYNRFVFKTKHNTELLRRFILILGFSWVANNLFFIFWVYSLNIHYSIATALNTLLLGIARFLAQKFYVHR